ncbi:MAG: FkbM family methyltransferase [Bacteroidetes bacterium]|jgi:FkbM family methyltransferase|nr:FkbM family methyltransferase [Bacteroidota bacterium]MCA6444052.1 FkbM family methyltransferase [Bacteroidota bacterium]
MQKNKYIEFLGEKGAELLNSFFMEIENGGYDKTKTLTVSLSNIEHPITLRCIRADMQSFVNTFIDPYLDKKIYLDNPNFIIDAGANIGYTAVLFANWWPNATIVSIEPDLENYELTLLNTKKYTNIHVLHAGLWYKNAKLQIEAGQEDGFVVREVSNETKISSQNLSEGISLDEILTRFKKNKIDFLKMNIEGSEKEVFSFNYQNWLPKTKAMLIELHDGKNKGCAKAVFNATNEYNFAVAETANYGILFCEENTYRNWYAQWYKENIYQPNINKTRFPKFYLDQEISK